MSLRTATLLALICTTFSFGFFLLIHLDVISPSDSSSLLRWVSLTGTVLDRGGLLLFLLVLYTKQKRE